MKKGRRAAGESTSSANSNKPNSGSASTPEQEKLSFDKDFLDDDSDNLDFKSALIKAKGKSGGWADEAIKSGSGKYDFFCCKNAKVITTKISFQKQQRQTEFN